MDRKRALTRYDGLAPRIEEHITKILANPESGDLNHWIQEVRSWIEQVEALLPAVGRRTSTIWRETIGMWKEQLGD
jgi:hypothetical protein